MKTEETKTIHYLITKDEETLLSFQQHDKTNIQIRKYNVVEGGKWNEDEEFLHERYANGYWSIKLAREMWKEYVREGWDICNHPSALIWQGE